MLIIIGVYRFVHQRQDVVILRLQAFPLIDNDERELRDNSKTVSPSDNCLKNTQAREKNACLARKGEEGIQQSFLRIKEVLKVRESKPFEERLPLSAFKAVFVPKGSSYIHLLA